MSRANEESVIHDAISATCWDARPFKLRVMKIEGELKLHEFIGNIIFTSVISGEAIDASDGFGQRHSIIPHFVKVVVLCFADMAEMKRTDNKSVRPYYIRLWPLKHQTITMESQATLRTFLWFSFVGMAT